MPHVKTLAIDCRMAQMSGIGVYLRNLVPLCMAAMPDVRFRLLGYDGTFMPPDGCTWEQIPFTAPIYSVAEQYAVLPLLKGCDALWTPHYPIPVCSNIPLVVTVHDMAHLALRGIYSGLKRLYAELMFRAVRFKAKELLFVSEFTRQEFMRLVGKPRGNMTVAHNGLHADWLSQPLQERSHPPYFLAVGNIKPHKNIHFLCHAFAKAAENRDVKLVIVGEHSGFRVGEAGWEKMEKICPGKISFTGFVSQETLFELMGGAAALVFPSCYEGFGMPLLEALGQGIPVLASDIPVTREVCGEHAMYFTLNSVDALAALFFEILANPAGAQGLTGEAGRAWAGRFTWENTAQASVAALRRVL